MIRKPHNFINKTKRLYQAEFAPLVADTGNRFLQDAYSNASLSGFIQSAFRLAIVFAAILAVMRITYAGFLYMTSDIADNKNKAKTTITNALLGLLLLLSLVIILGQINPNILNLDINLESVQQPSSTQQNNSSQPTNTASDPFDVNRNPSPNTNVVPVGPGA